MTAAFESGPLIERGLLADALLGGKDAIGVVATLPASVWCDSLHADAASAIRSLVADGRTVDVAGVLAEIGRLELKVSAGELSSLASMECHPTCDPYRDAGLLREAQAEREWCEQKRHMRAVLDDHISREEWRHFHAELEIGGADGNLFPPLTAWRELAARPVPWTFQDAIPGEAVSVIAGPGGVGKSAFARGLALSMITGRTIFASFRPTRQAPVMVLSGEDSTALYLCGIIALAHAHDIPPQEVDDGVINRLHLRALGARPFLVMDTAKNTTTTSYYRTISDEAARRGLGLLVIDTARKHSGAWNENDNVAMGTFVEACAAIATRAKCAVVLIHHSHKNAEGNSQGDLRGASAIADESRCVWVMTGTDRGITLNNVKQSYGPRCAPADFEFCHGAGLIETTEARTPEIILQTMVGWLTRNPQSKVTPGGIKTRKGDGEDLVATLSTAHPWVSKQIISAAIETGLSTGRLRLEEARGTNGRPMEILKVGTPQEDPYSDDTAF